MGGGLMQLVAYGAQDIYLTGNPQITFFKVVYRRHTNFSMESIEQTMSGSSIIGATPVSPTCTISRNGDLISKIYLNFPTKLNLKNGSNLIREVELEIGGQKIDKHTNEWMNIWNELTTPESKALGFKAMIGDSGVGSADGVSTGVKNIQIPLQFWFCRNPGLALPLIALQYHEVKLKFKFGTAVDLGGAGATVTPTVVVDYIYLDTDERRRFAQVSHEYLIEQVQIQSGNANNTININLNHPIKE